MQYLFLGILSGYGSPVLFGGLALLVIYVGVSWWSSVQEQREQERDVNFTYFRDNAARAEAKANWNRAYQIWSGYRRPESQKDVKWLIFDSEFHFRLAAIQFFEHHPVLLAEAWQEFGHWVKMLEPADNRSRHHVLNVQETIGEANQMAGERASDWELVEDNLETNSMGWEK